MHFLIAWLFILSALFREDPGMQYAYSLSDCTCVPSVNPVDTFLVTNTLDSGDGSLRCAIECANASPNLSYILFEIPVPENSTWFPVEPYPTLNKNLQIIDTSRLAKIDGSLLNNPGDHGFRISGDSVRIEGLHIQHFPNNGIDNYFGHRKIDIIDNVIEFNGRISDSGDGIDFRMTENARILGNKIRQNGKDGIYLQVTENIQIQGNEISGNEQDGINILTGKYIRIGDSCPNCSNWIHSNQKNGIIATQHSSFLEIYNNYIGLSTQMVMALPNLEYGINLSRCDSSLIGKYNGGNYLSGNGIGGISMMDSCQVITLRNNRIGLSVFSGIGLPNGQYGVKISESGNILIGGDLESFGNKIGYHPFNVHIDGNSEHCALNKNLFYCSTNSLFLEPGANEGISPPEDFELLANDHIAGIAQEGDLIQLYRKNPECQPCQGNEFVSSTIASGPDGAWELFLSDPLEEWENISVIRTDTLGNTSTFSSCRFFECETFQVQIIPEGNPYLCENSVLTLTVSSGESFTWSTGETTSAIEISESGYYSVTVEDKWGCPASDSIYIPVYPSPELSLIPSDSTVFCNESMFIQAIGQGFFEWNTGVNGPIVQVTESGNYCVSLTNPYDCVTTSCVPVTKGDTVDARIDLLDLPPFCDGETIRLIASGGTAYRWNVEEKTSPEINITESGRYQVTVTNEYGCSDTASRRVDFVPAADGNVWPGGYLILCYGDSLKLTAGGGSSYLWNDGSTGPEKMVHGWGTYTVTISNEFGCEEVISRSVSVKPRILADIHEENPIRFCEPESAWITVQYSTMDSIVWNTGDTGDSLLVTSSGIYSAEVFNLGCSETDSIEVVVYPQPLGVDSIAGPSWSFIDSIQWFHLLESDPAVEYIWEVDGGFILSSDAESLQIEWSRDDFGLICVTAIDTNGCESEPYCRMIDLAPLSLQQLHTPTVLIYPNPANTLLNVLIESERGPSAIYLEFYDPLGQLCARKPLVFTPNRPEAQVDVSDIASGIYWVKLSGNLRNSIFQKILLTR